MIRRMKFDRRLVCSVPLLCMWIRLPNILNFTELDSTRHKRAGILAAAWKHSGKHDSVIVLDPSLRVCVCDSTCFSYTSFVDFQSAWFYLV